MLRGDLRGGRAEAELPLDLGDSETLDESDLRLDRLKMPTGSDPGPPQSESATWNSMIPGGTLTELIWFGVLMFMECPRHGPTHLYHGLSHQDRLMASWGQ